ncbi:type IV pilus assembly protein PilM [Orenia metallireducens]|uniref:Type IV pilus assembly protein PilM n=1 Tax=Orenia metallireducens TaxID=1413210 RepID=A0A285HK23_9FIRM|nr:type IV pilus assembly protein PilM [Orenia metallireducens]SNY36082.1 type IV pilus assembly protein PilM [Orenia metallireducens]
MFIHKIDKYKNLILIGYFRFGGEILFNIFKNSGRLGIEISNSIKIAEFKENKFKTGEYKQLTIEELKNFTSKDTITSISTKDIKIKFIKIPDDLSTKEIEQMVELEFADENLVIQHEVVESLQEKYVIGYGVEKPLIKERFEQLKALKLKPKVVETEFHANIRYLYSQYPDLSETVSLIDIGDKTTDLIIAQGGRLIFLRSFDFAGRHITEKLATINRITSEQAERYKKQGVTKEELRIILEELRSQIYQSIDYFQSEYKVRVAKLFLTGGSSNFKGLQSYLEDQIGIEAIKLEDNLYSVVKGLALREE